MSSVRLPRKQNTEVLSQTSAHARTVRRQTKQRDTRGRRGFDTHEQRAPQSVSLELCFFSLTT